MNSPFDNASSSFTSKNGSVLSVEYLPVEDRVRISIDSNEVYLTCEQVEGLFLALGDAIPITAIEALPSIASALAPATGVVTCL